MITGVYCPAYNEPVPLGIIDGVILSKHFVPLVFSVW